MRIFFKSWGRTAKPLSGRRVHRLCGNASLRSTQLALERLVVTGVLSADRTSSATFYSVNTDHLLWPLIEQSLLLRGELFRRIGDLAAGMDVTIVVFGSVARGDSSPASDIDLLVVSGATETGTDTLIDRLHELLPAWTGNAVQVYDVTVQELREKVRMEDPIIETWLAEALLLYGDTLQDRLKATR